MEKITFENGKTPALNATNLNQLQTNTENAITQLQTNTENAITQLQTNTENAINEVKTNGAYVGGESLNNVDYNNYFKTGFYYMGLNCTNAPSAYCKLIVIGYPSGNQGDCVQIAISVSGAQMYFRSGSSSTNQINWSPWKTVSAS